MITVSLTITVTITVTVTVTVTVTITVTVTVTVMVVSRDDHGRVTGRSRYCHGTVALMSRDGHGTVTPLSRDGHGGVTSCKYLSRHASVTSRHATSRLHDSNVIFTVILLKLKMYFNLNIPKNITLKLVNDELVSV